MSPGSCSVGQGQWHNPPHPNCSGLPGGPGLILCNLGWIFEYINTPINQLVGYRPKGVACMPATPVVGEDTLWYPLYLAVLALIACYKYRRYNCPTKLLPIFNNSRLTLDPALLDPCVKDAVGDMYAVFWPDSKSFSLNWSAKEGAIDVFQQARLHEYEGEFIKVVVDTIRQIASHNDPNFLVLTTQTNSSSCIIVVMGSAEWYWCDFHAPRNDGPMRAMNCYFRTNGYVFHPVCVLSQKLVSCHKEHTRENRQAQLVWKPDGTHGYIAEGVVLAVVMSLHGRLGEESFMGLLSSDVIRTHILPWVAYKNSPQVLEMLSERCEQHPFGLITDSVDKTELGDVLDDFYGWIGGSVYEHYEVSEDDPLHADDDYVSATSYDEGN